jgi:tetratricopeptide (TPR) repeat protein
MSGFDPAIAERIEQRAAALRREPRDGEPWRRLGMLYHAHDRFDLAADCYRESRALDPQEPRTHFYLALVDQRQGRTAEAIAGLERVIELAGGYAPARWRLALLRLAEGDAPAAREAAEGALTAVPGDRYATLVLARAHLQAGEAGEAAELLESHLAAVPGDRYAHFLLGGAYRRLGRGEEARRHLVLGQGAEPGWSDPWSDELQAERAGFPAELAAATELLGPEPARAVAELERLRGERPENVTLLINLGIGYRRTGRLEDSAEALRQAVEREPSRGLGHFHLAVTCSELARRAGTASAAEFLARALEHAERAVELQPTSARNHALHGEILAQAGRPAEAVEAYRRAARDPQDPAWLHRLGALLCQLRRWDEAIPVLASFLERAGDDAGALFLLGAAQANAGDLEAARATLERARRRSPEDPKILEALAQLERARRGAGGGA